MTQNDETVVNQWNLIRAFLALERHGDYAIAAEKEGIDDATLRRRIRALEQHLGRTLFVRTERGWKTASDQYELVQAALRMEEAARVFSRSRQEGAGIIRITVLDTFAQQFSRVFGVFREKYPRLVLDITTELQFVDLEKDQVDIAIRMARPLQASNSLRIRKLGDVPINVYASSAYLQKLKNSGEKWDVGSLPQLSMNLNFSHGDHNFTYRDLGAKEFGLNGKVVTYSNNFPMLARMCEQGLGVAILPTILASDFESLEPIYPDRPVVTTELWMISRFDLRADWQRDLADMLQAELAKWNA